MPYRFDQVYKFAKVTFLTVDVLNVRFQDIDNRIAPLEALDISWQAALLVVQDKVLAASEAVIASLRNRLVEITQLEWLVAFSATPLTLSVGATQALIVVPDDRDLFAPGPYAILSNTTDPDCYAVVKTLSYAGDLGQYNFVVESIAGSPGPNAGWQIAAVAGSTLAQMSYLAQGLAALASTNEAAAAGHADRLAADADALATAADRTAIQADRLATDASATDAHQSATNASGSAAAAAASANLAQSYVTGAGLEQTAHKGQAAGYASLDGSAKVPAAQLPIGTTSGTVAAGDTLALETSTRASQAAFAFCLAALAL